MKRPIKRKWFSTQPVAVTITYPVNCRWCKEVIEKQVDAVERTIISKGRDAYTRAPIVRHTLLPFCSATCANMYQELADSEQ